MKVRSVVISIALVALAACSLPPIPMGSVSESGEVTQGEIYPGLGSSTFTFEIVGTDVFCTGVSTPQGESDASCSNGTSITFDIPDGEYGNMDGWYFSQDGNGFGPTVSGWGMYANEDWLRAKLAEYL